MGEVRVEAVDYDAVAHFKRPAIRAGVDVKPYDDSTWYAAWRDDTMVGCACSHRLGRGKVKLRGVYVPPEHRRQGISRVLFERQFADALRSGVTLVCAFARSGALPLYLQYGFEIRRWCGSTAYVEYEVER